MSYRILAVLSFSALALACHAPRQETACEQADRWHPPMAMRMETVQGTDGTAPVYGKDVTFDSGTYRGHSIEVHADYTPRPVSGSQLYVRIDGHVVAVIDDPHVQTMGHLMAQEPGLVLLQGQFFTDTTNGNVSLVIPVDSAERSRRPAFLVRGYTGFGEGLFVSDRYVQMRQACGPSVHDDQPGALYRYSDGRMTEVRDTLVLAHVDSGINFDVAHQDSLEQSYAAGYAARARHLNVPDPDADLRRQRIAEAQARAAQEARREQAADEQALRNGSMSYEEYVRRSNERAQGITPELRREQAQMARRLGCRYVPTGDGDSVLTCPP